MPLIPASNTKIVTAAAALETLGEDYRFHTEVIRRAPVVDGVLDGRLYLKGYGDPTLRQADLARLAQQVRGGRDHQGHRQADRGRELLRLACATTPAGPRRTPTTTTPAPISA